MGWNLPGQSRRWCGQAIQVASCGSHSAGIRQPACPGNSMSDDPPILRVRASATIEVNSIVGAHPPMGADRTKTILLVDDDAEIVQGLRAVLEGRGYRVVSAPDGAAG